MFWEALAEASVTEVLVGVVEVGAAGEVRVFRVSAGISLVGISGSA